jgi:non-specific serine/threonine protein kinase
VTSIRANRPSGRRSSGATACSRPGEQLLFARLAAFVGGCTLEAAETVCGADLDTLQSLVDKSLVRRTRERFWMLETIRELAVERMQALGAEAPELRRHLAEHFLALAREAQRDLLRGLRQRTWHAAVDAELDNIRAVLAWGFGNDAASAAELAAALGRYWWMRAPHEGATWLERAAAVPELPTRVRAEVLEALGGTVWFLGDSERTGVLVAESLELYRGLGDRAATGRLLNMAGPPLAVAGRLDEAERVLGEALALNEELGAYGEVTLSHSLLSFPAQLRGDLERSAALLERSIALAREHDILWLLVNGLLNLADVRLTQGTVDAAGELVREALSIAPELGGEATIVEGLGLASAIAAAAGDDETAGRLWGAAERPYERLGKTYLRDEMERFRELLADRGDAFEDARRRGRLLTLEEAIALAVGESV